MIPALALALLSTAAEPSLVDRVLCKEALDAGRAPEAKALVPGVKTGAPAAAPVDTAADLARGEALLAKKDARPADAAAALLAFQRALARAPTTAAPLWGISRAADAAHDPQTGRRFAALYVRSLALDKTPALVDLAKWRLEQPDETAPLAPTTPQRTGALSPLLGGPATFTASGAPAPGSPGTPRAPAVAPPTGPGPL